MTNTPDQGQRPDTSKYVQIPRPLYWLLLASAVLNIGIAANSTIASVKGLLHRQPVSASVPTAPESQNDWACLQLPDRISLNGNIINSEQYGWVDLFFAPNSYNTGKPTLNVQIPTTDGVGGDDSHQSYTIDVQRVTTTIWVPDALYGPQVSHENDYTIGVTKNGQVELCGPKLNQ